VIVFSVLRRFRVTLNRRMMINLHPPIGKKLPVCDPRGDWA
jgi:hypothetical protein